MGESGRPPSLVFIFGPPAVGKMTVGQELQKLTGFRLLYNHLVIDLVTRFFEFGSDPFQRLSSQFTVRIIEECANEGASLIVTHGLMFDKPIAPSIIREWSAPFRAVGGAVHHVGLAAPLEIRLERNVSENRRRHKRIDWATERLLREMESWGRWHNLGELSPEDPHIVIDNTKLAPADAARRIVDRLGLQALAEDRR